MHCANHPPNNICDYCRQRRGSNTKDDCRRADNRLCSLVPIKANIGYLESRSYSRYEAVNDQLDLRVIDMGVLYCGSQSKTDYDRLIERLKRGV